jgi:mannose-1-phosphate guanylyltransferase
MMRNHINGSKIELESATHSYVYNNTDTPVAVIGLDNVVVVSTPNGILVTNKNYAQKVGDVAKRLQKS